uniref:Small monomeric GTPase n=1 Tax=Chelydra serpentina TaxID=8475 RepID=A0A8C3T683_CHESE
PGSLGGGREQQSPVWGTQPGHRTPPTHMRSGGKWGSDTFTQLYFVSDYDLTTEDFYMKICSIDGTPTQLDFLDMAGQREFGGPWELCMCPGKGSCSFVPSVTTAASMRSFPMILVGNKANLDLQQQVPKEEALAFVQEIASPYTEGTASTWMSPSTRSSEPSGGSRSWRTPLFTQCTSPNKESESCPCCVLY